MDMDIRPTSTGSCGDLIWKNHHLHTKDLIIPQKTLNESNYFGFMCTIIQSIIITPQINAPDLRTDRRLHVLIIYPYMIFF